MRTGGCVCGEVRYEAELTGETLGACHCGTCRKWTGGPFVTVNATVAFEGTPRIYRSSEWAERGFCGTCGSSLFYRLAQAENASLYLAAGTLDDLSGLVLDHEVFTDRRPAGYRFAGELRGMTEAEVFAQFAPKSIYSSR